MHPTSGPARGHDYVICTTHRSGSNLLCEALTRTVGAGRPREHILRIGTGHAGFDPERHRHILDLLPPPGAMPPPGVDLIARAREEGTDDKGIFATKIMLHNFDALTRRLGLPPVDVMRQLTPGLLCIFLTRQDKDAQAVSAWTSRQTRSWHASQPEQAEPVYHFEAIDLVRRLHAEQERHWCELFATAGMIPYAVTYEELVARRDETIGGLLRFIGVDETAPIPAPMMQRQSGARSADWIARYRAERAARGDDQ